MNRFALPILYFVFVVTNANGAGHRFEQSGEAEPPGPYVYDPIRGVSETNANAWQAGEKLTVETALQPGDSFTVEAFAKPDAGLETKPRDILPVFALGDDRTVLVTGIRRSPPPHSYQWWSAHLRVGSGTPIDLTRQRYNGIAMVRGETPWRHVAVTWDAPTRCLSFFLDYRLQQSTILDEVPDWDLARLKIGRSDTADRSFVGCIDEVRVTAEALKPWYFLRAATEPFDDVSFGPEEEPALPAEYGHVDVRLHYGAVGDDLPFFQFEMLGASHVRHASPAALVFRHCAAGHITAASGCGDLFIEDAGGKWRFNEHQRVWGRQLNPETKGIPEIINNGGQLWVLGLKTEYLSTKIENRNGARTEVLGGLMYPVHPVEDESLPMFLNENSDISLIHAVSVYNKNHKVYMRDTQRGEPREHRQWHWVSGRPISNLYRSRQSVGDVPSGSEIHRTRIDQ